jgi:hypothetical protein
MRSLVELEDVLAVVLLADTVVALQPHISRVLHYDLHIEF